MDDHWIQRLFSGTRGRIILRLRRAEHSVSDLAEALDLTDNAIRAQITKLERDGLAEATGKRPGHRKPETLYGLTEQAETLFPRAYDLLLDQLLAVLNERGDDVEALLQTVGTRFAERFSDRVTAVALDDRLQQVLKVLEEIGGVPQIESAEDETLVVRGRSCPFGHVVPQHPAVCLMTEAFLAQLADRPVRQQCEPKGDSPQCRFVLAQDEDGEADE